MAGRSGFAITISAVDQTASPLENINKRLARLNVPAERFNRAMSRFGDVSGINRLSEGFGSLTRTAHDAFMSIDRVSGPLGAITGAASIAGVVTLTQRWADLGSKISMTSYRLSMPVERLSALQGAAKRFGSTAEQADQSLSGLRDTLYDAVYRGQGRQFLSAVGIDPGTPGHITDTMTAFEKLADRVAGEKDVHTKLRIMGEAHIDQSLLPLMNLGGAGIEKEMQRQRDLGGTVTQQMSDDALKAKRSFEDLGTAIGGVANRLGDTLSKQIRPWVDASSQWIGANQGLADSYAKIGTEAVAAAAGISLVSKALGFGFLSWASKVVPPLLPLGLTGPAGGEDPEFSERKNDEFKRNRGASWFGQGWPRWLGGSGDRSAPAITVPKGPTNSAAVMRRVHDYFRSKGLSEEQTAGILANVAAESGFNPASVGDNGTSFGLFQHHADRLAAMQRRYNTATPSEQQQLDFAWDELNGPEHATLDRLRSVNTPSQAGAVFAGYERPAGGQGEAMRRGQAADQFVQRDAVAAGRSPGYVADGAPGAPGANGNVHVEVTLKGAPPGTTAKVASSGQVTAPPARIEMPLPGVN